MGVSIGHKLGISRRATLHLCPTPSLKCPHVPNVVQTGALDTCQPGLGEGGGLLETGQGLEGGVGQP